MNWRTTWRCTAILRQLRQRRGNHSYVWYHVCVNEKIGNELKSTCHMMYSCDDYSWLALFAKAHCRRPGGYDKIDQQPSLYFVDYMESLAKLNFAANRLPASSYQCWSFIYLRSVKTSWGRGSRYLDSNPSLNDWFFKWTIKIITTGYISTQSCDLGHYL
jgi:hypothetical protein